MQMSRPPVLELTGFRRGPRYVIKLKGKELPLPATLFMAICDLVLARATKRAGFVPLSPYTARRLRIEIDRAFSKKSAGHRFIITGAIGF